MFIRWENVHTKFNGSILSWNVPYIKPILMSLLKNFCRISKMPQYKNNEPVNRFFHYPKKHTSIFNFSGCHARHFPLIQATVQSPKAYKKIRSIANPRRNKSSAVPVRWSTVTTNRRGFKRNHFERTHSCDRPKVHSLPQSFERREKFVGRERLEIPIICILSVTTVARLFLSQQLWRLLFSLFAWSSESGLGTLAGRDSLHILKGRPTYPRHPCRLTASVFSDKHVLESRAH